MEQIRGIEPLTSEWKSDILPLNYICILWTIIVHYLLIRKISKFSLQTVYNIFIVFSTTFKKRNTILQSCNTNFLREKLFTHFKHLLIIFIDNPIPLLGMDACNLMSYLYTLQRVVEDVGFEPLYSIPNAVCYHYTTSSMWRLEWDSNPRTISRLVA